MDIKVIVDKESEFRMRQAADALEEYCQKNRIKAYGTDMIVIFSNNHNFVKEVVEKYPKMTSAINVTENLSEQHVINVLRYVADVCYLKSDANIIAARIINACNRNRQRKRA